MANIKKSFNFRSGVQVDDDNLVVSPTGLIGIGTTVPTQALDIRGDFVCSGLTSAVNAKVTGVLTATSFNPTEIIGAGVSIKAGIITGEAGDIVTYFGDGSNLLNLPTSQWEDTNAGFAVSSIYNRGSTVGIATTNPQSTLQVGNDPNNGQIGVGIASAGHIKVSGAITATTYSGDFAGTVSGTTTGKINVTSGISTFNNVQVSGIITAPSGQNKIPALYATLNDLPSATEYHGMFAHVHATGKGYYSHAGAWFELVNKNTAGNVELSGDIDVDGHTNLDNVSIAGVTTFSDDVVIGVGATVGIGTTVIFDDDVKLKFGSTDGLEIYHSQNLAGTNDSYIDSSARNLFIRLNTETDNGGNIALQAKKDEHGILIHDDGAVDLYYDNTKRLATSGIGATVFGQLDTTHIDATGIITATTALNTPLLGIGTDNPANDIQVRKNGNTEIQITSDTGSAGITVGREPSTANTNNAEFRYGAISPSFPYSSAQSLDLINYGTGNFNYHLSANNAGSAAGDFHWHKGKNNARLMTLTNTGRLGIGITLPTEALDVGGNAKIRGTTTFDDIVTIQGGLNIAAGSLTVGDITTNIIGNITGNVNATSGLSTFFNIKVTGTNSNFAAIGIKTENTGNIPLDLFGDGASTEKRLFVTADARIGIKTDEINPGIDINAVDSRVSIQSMGVGTTNPQSAVDMRFAGQELTGIFANRMYMYPPQVNNTQRGNLAGVAAGAVIYNTSTNKLQVYNGSAWQDCN